MRVSEIQKKTNIDDWHHIPSDQNVADLLTKGAAPNKIGPGTIWQSGPAWLVEDRVTWPITKLVLDEVDKQEVSKFVSKTRLDDLKTCLTVKAGMTNNSDGHILKTILNRSSNLNFILRVTSLVRRAINKFKLMLKKKIEASSNSNHDLDQKGRTTVVRKAI